MGRSLSSLRRNTLWIQRSSIRRSWRPLTSNQMQRMPL
uniref:Uncharacterized protein n=1 Tax=Anguilla anguilla TaxID=7936 RepID=A0A0E9XTY7_ANGAN